MAETCLSRGVPAAHAPKLETSRRALIGGAGLAVVVAAVPAIASLPAHADVIAELDALDAITRALEANPRTTEDQWDAWQERQHTLYRRVEALPATRENVPVKVRAIRSIYLDEPAFHGADPAGSTDEALAQQIVRALAGEA